MTHSDEPRISAGDAVTFVASGDRLQLSVVAPRDGENALRAKVVGEEFVGATATIHMEAPHGSELITQKSHDDLLRFPIRVGGEVFVSWPAGPGHILPHQ